MLPRRLKGFTKNDICSSNWPFTDPRVRGNVINWKSYGFLRETVVKTTDFACKPIRKSMKIQWNIEFSSKITRFKKKIVSDFFIFFKKNHGQKNKIEKNQTMLSSRLLVFLVGSDNSEERLSRSKKTIGIWDAWAA